MSAITVIRPNELTRQQVASWSRFQQADPSFASPFFRPEFTQAVGAVREDVEVAILEEAGGPLGFFPFQRTRGNIANPVGGPLSDYQGAVVRQGIAFDAEQLIRGCGLKAWHFNHLIASQKPFAPYHCAVAESPYVDLSRGFDAYLAEKRRAGSGTLAQVRRKSRKIEREIGPLRLQSHTTNKQIFETLIRWKMQQYQRIKAVNYLAPDWTVELLDRIRDLPSAEFSGMLSVLYAGDQPAAIHLGIRSSGVLHVWFPVYDHTLSRYSPGLILWLELAQAAESLGIQRIDFGKGRERYKASLQSGATRLAEGSVDTRFVSRSLRRRWIRTREWVRSSPLNAPARCVVRNVRAWLTECCGSY